VTVVVVAALPAMSVADADGVQVIAAAVALVDDAPLAEPKTSVMLAPLRVIVDGVAAPLAPYVTDDPDPVVR
jgi:hypothetical protein